MSDMIDRLAGALADRYTIQEELGAGGMAITGGQAGWRTGGPLWLRCHV